MSPVFIPKPKWDSATQIDIGNYHEQLDIRLLQKPPPECLVSCDDLQYKSHSHEIYQLHNTITHACSEVARVANWRYLLRVWVVSESQPVFQGGQ